MPTKGYRKCRYKITVNGKRIPRSHYTWNLNHPEDPVLPGEIIHHVDHNYQNDDISNLQKFTDKQHRVAEMKNIRRTTGPVKVSPEQAKKGYAGMKQYYLDHPEEYAILMERRRQATIAANKRRIGEKRSNEWKQQQSNRLKEQWKNGKRNTSKIFGRGACQREGNCLG